MSPVQGPFIGIQGISDVDAEKVNIFTIII